MPRTIYVPETKQTLEWNGRSWQIPPSGAGVVTGGTVGQVLAKIDSTDYNTQWITTITQSPWIAPTLLNAWANLGNGNAGVAYFKDSLGLVHLKGFIGGGSGVIFTLPTGYRPLETHTIPITANNAFANIYIRSSGEVTFQVGSTSSVSLCDITFRAEQ